MTILFKTTEETEQYGEALYQSLGESKLVFLSLEISSVNNKVFKAWENDKVSKRWIPLIKNLRKRKKYQLSPLVEEILVEKGIGTNAYRDKWQLFDQIILSKPFLTYPSGLTLETF